MHGIKANITNKFFSQKILSSCFVLTKHLIISFAAMEWLFPSFLWASLALAIPVVIHLFRFRKYKTVYFTNVRLLRELIEENTSRNRIKNWLLLAMRILALLFLVLAFAIPFASSQFSGGTQNKQNISLFLDNGLNMQAPHAEGRKLDAALSRAEYILSNLNSNDKMRLLTRKYSESDRKPKIGTDLEKELSSTIITPETHDWSSIINRMLYSKVDQEKNTHLVLISDFQGDLSILDNLAPNDSLNVSLVHIEDTKLNNIWIDSVWSTDLVWGPGGNFQLDVRVEHNSSKLLEGIALELWINNEINQILSLNLPQTGSLDTNFKFQLPLEGNIKVEVKLPDAPIDFDNSVHVLLPLRERIRVLEISEKTTKENYIERAFSTETYFNYQSVSNKQIDLNELNNTDFLILHESSELSSGLFAQLNQLIINGMRICIIPSKTSVNSALNTFLSDIGAPTFLNLDTNKIKVQNINYNHPLFNNVFRKKPENADLPNFYWLRPQNQGKTYSDVLLSNISQTSILTATRFGRGEIFVLSGGIGEEHSDFHKHPLFLPFLFQMALYKNNTSDLYYTIGEDASIELKLNKNINSTDAVFSIRNEKNNFEFIPQTNIQNGLLKLNQLQRIEEPGFYQLLHQDEVMAEIAFNFSRQTSNAKLNTSETILSAFREVFPQAQIIEEDRKSFEREWNSSSQPSGYWKWMLIAALLFLALEAIVTRIHKS